MKRLRELFESTLFGLFLMLSSGLMVFLAWQIDKADVFYQQSYEYIEIVSPGVLLLLASLALFLTAFITLKYIKREGDKL